MNAIVFDREKLNKNDRRIYDAMTDSEKTVFERTWVSIETQKQRLAQCKNSSKERNIREKRVMAERERKERTHRLIEYGAILESTLTDHRYFDNKEISKILRYAFSCDEVSTYIEDLKNKYSTTDDIELIEVEEDDEIYV